MVEETNSSRKAPTSSERTKVVAYLRVSTEKQADLGCSLDAQRAKVEAYCALYELDLVSVQVDAGLSAKSLDRPALDAALGMLKDGTAQALLVVKLDRLTRSVVDIGHLIERYFQPGQAALLSVGEQIDTRSAGGRLVLNVLVSVSQWEREAISDRTRQAMQYKRQQGEFCGGHPPYGFTNVDGRLIEHTSEQATINRARQLASEGYSLSRIGGHLAREGRMTRQGTAWSDKQVSRLIEQERKSA